MIYNGNSYKINYENNDFDSILELTWFLFLNKAEISKYVLSHPLDYKFGLKWYPDLKFSILTPKYLQFFAEVKPLPKSEFHIQLNLSKYNYDNNMICVLGESNLDHLVLNGEETISNEFNNLFNDRSNLWIICNKTATEFAQKYGSFKKNDFIKNDIRLTFGKYDGFTLKEVKERDINYYNWYLKKFDE